MNEHRRNEQNKSGLLVAEEQRVDQQGACELIETILRKGVVYHRRTDKLNSRPRRMLFTGKIPEGSLLLCSISGSKIMQEFALKMRWTSDNFDINLSLGDRIWLNFVLEETRNFLELACKFLWKFIEIL